VVYFGHNRLAIGRVVVNSGISFGWLNSTGQWLTIGLMVGIMYFLIIQKNSGGWLWIMIGGAANLIDRVRFGGVRDYWYLGGGWYNNINDWIITLGVIWLLIDLWKQQSKLSTKKQV